MDLCWFLQLLLLERFLDDILVLQYLLFIFVLLEAFLTTVLPPSIADMNKMRIVGDNNFEEHSLIEQVTSYLFFDFLYEHRCF